MYHIFYTIILWFSDCPNEIPKFNIESKAANTNASQSISEDASSVMPSVNNEMSDMSMSIEVDMADASMVKE